MKSFIVKRPLTLKMPPGFRRSHIQEIQEIKDPPASPNWMPIPHALVIQSILDSILDRNLSVSEINHHISMRGRRYIGSIDVSSHVKKSNHTWFVFIRNFNDSSEPLTISTGCRILASNAVAFLEDIKTTINHTPKAVRDISGRAESLIQTMHSNWSRHDQRIEEMKSRKLFFNEMSGLLIRAAEDGIISFLEMKKILRSYRKPTHVEFSSRTAWSLYNAMLAIKLSAPISTVIQKTIEITKLFDKFLQIKIVVTPFVQTEML